MPFNLLLLPLLGGYVFLRCWNYTKFYILRSSNERLLIASSLAGITLLASSYALNVLATYLFPCSKWSFCILTLWNQWVPIEYSGVAFGAFMMGVLACNLFNVFFEKDKQIDRIITRDAEPLELLLRTAQVERIPVSITLNTDKVYVGRITHQFNPGTATNHISLMPTKSGYRDKDTQEMILAHDYTQTYANIKKDADAVIDEVRALRGSNLVKARELVNTWLELTNLSERFVLVIPVNQIISANLFDSDLHKKYFETTILPPPAQLPTPQD